MTLGHGETYAALHEGVVGRVVERDVVVVAGPGAASFLQGQCSQDLAGMVAGEARRSLLLSPQGKVVALVRVVAMPAQGRVPEAGGEPERFVVEVDRGFGEAVLERLRRFKLRVKADLGLAAWRCAEVRGPGAGEALARRVAERAGTEPVDAEAVLLRLDDRFGHGWDLLGPDAELAGDVTAGDRTAFEAARIEAGVPAMGSELDESVIPQEAGIVLETVSLTKGCYTGQELVARLDARGNRVPKLLRAVVIADIGPAQLPAVGSELLVGDRVVGTLTSTAWSPRLAAGVGLAYVRREVEPPAEVRIAQGRGALVAASPLVAEVREVPL